MLLDVDVREWPCLVVGAGPVGSRRALRLVDAGASVHVVAPEATTSLRDAAAAGRLRWSRRSFDAADVAGCRLVVVATGVPAVDDAVTRALPDGVLCNRADDADAGDVRVPAVAADDGVVVAVVTPSRVPAWSAWLAGRLHDALEGIVGLDSPGRTVLGELLGEIRQEGLAIERPDGSSVTPAGLSDQAAASVVDWRSGLDRSMLDPVLLDLIRTGRRAEAKERLQACLSSS